MPRLVLEPGIPTIDPANPPRREDTVLTRANNSRLGEVTWIKSLQAFDGVLHDRRLAAPYQYQILSFLTSNYFKHVIHDGVFDTILPNNKERRELLLRRTNRFEVFRNDEELMSRVRDIPQNGAIFFPPYKDDLETMTSVPGVIAYALLNPEVSVYAAYNLSERSRWERQLFSPTTLPADSTLQTINAEQKKAALREVKRLARKHPKDKVALVLDNSIELLAQDFAPSSKSSVPLVTCIEWPELIKAALSRSSVRVSDYISTLRESPSEQLEAVNKASSLQVSVFPDLATVEAQLIALDKIEVFPGQSGNHAHESFELFRELLGHALDASVQNKITELFMSSDGPFKSCANVVNARRSL